MRTLAALERFFERLFERPSARVFGARIEPVQLLRRIEREMEAGRIQARDGTIVPDRFAVALHPSDLSALGAHGSSLAADLADSALRFARAHGYRLHRRPRVDLVPDPRVEPGDPRVVARFDADGAAAGVWSASPPPGDVSLTPLAGEADPSDATIVYRPPQAVGPLARLRVLEPTGGDRSILLEGGGLTIGRAPDNGLVLGDGRASRHHAHLHLRQGTLVLVDLDSRNGTFVNGQRVTEMALGVGDQIVVGDTRLLVEALAAV
jgi:hypothetical protein